MRSRVLVTGGAGFIGSHTVDLLLSKGYAVRILDNLQERVHPHGKPDYIPPEAEFQLGDVANRGDMERALDGVDYVIHLAAYQDYLPDFSTFIHTNAESTALIYELIVARNLPIRKVVVASSQAIYGEGKYECREHGVIYPDSRPLEQLRRGDWEVKCPQCRRDLAPVWITEDQVKPFTAYGISKYALELLAFNLGRRYGVPAVAMRYTYVQGPRNSFYNAYSGVCRIFTLRVLNGAPPVVYEDGKQLRDYVWVGDVAAANVLCMERSEADFRAFNVGGGKAISVLEFANVVLKVADETGKLRPSVRGDFRYGDTRHTFSDISALRSLGWEPTLATEEVVRRYVEWVRTKADARDYYEESEKVMRDMQVVQTVG
jgi:dTDP-L-rhamnose 4-epimerase